MPSQLHSTSQCQFRNFHICLSESLLETKEASVFTVYFTTHFHRMLIRVS